MTAAPPGAPDLEGRDFDAGSRQVDALRLHARASRGAPPGETPAVLVHGLGLSGRYMLPTARAMADRFRVFVPDMPGFGDSEKPRETLSITGLADAVAGWMRASGLAPALLLANSFGCQVLIEVALRHPDLVRALVLQGPTTPPEERTWRAQYRAWRRNAPFNRPGMSEIAWSDYRKAGYHRVLGTFRQSLRDRPEDKLAAIAAPALVVRGEFDPICHGGWAARVAQGLPRGHLAELPHVAHTLVWDSPAELGALAVDFARSVGCR